MQEQNYNSGDVGGDIIGAGSSGIVAREIKGNVIQLVINSPDTANKLDNLAKMPTEVRQNQAAGVSGNTLPAHSSMLQESINELLAIMRKSESPGKNINEIQAGNTHLSRVDLLLKKAILLKSDADQIRFEHINHSSTSNQAAGYGNQPGGSFPKQQGTTGKKHYFDKLREAYTLLEEANEIEPANTEVLLHMAQLLMELTPDDPTDEQKLLRRIRNLLTTPKDDIERFRLAQATYLMAISAKNRDNELLNDARNMFDRLGRDEWVRQCDEILMADIDKKYIPHQTEFHPVGRWNVQVSDFMNSTMFLIIHPNGYFEATQQAGMLGTVAQATGQWGYMPQQRFLQLQGVVNGFMPLMLGITIHGQQGNTFYGAGNDGYAYIFLKS